MSYTNDLSTAIFAPGWIFEKFDIQNFIENDRKYVYSMKYDK